MGDIDLILERFSQLEKMIQAIPPAQALPAAEIIDENELCKRLRLSKPTVRDWRTRKKIPSITDGAVIRYNWPSVITALEKKNGK